MEFADKIVSGNKRKLEDIYEEDDGFSRFPLNELNQDLLERVLSWLPTSSFFRLTSVCQKWRSLISSATFTRACSDIPSRDPWFLMVHSQPGPARHTIIFDSAEKNWRKLESPEIHGGFLPVAASGGLICFRRADGDFVVANPVTTASRQIPDPQAPILAIAMVSKAGSSFKLVLISGELPDLTFREYSSVADRWGEHVPLTRKSDCPGRPASVNGDDCTHFYLSKCGNVVSTDIQRSPSKQFSSILTVENGDEVLHFLSPSGTIISCNLARKSFFEYPRILPVFSEYSIDLVEIGGQMRVVLLSEFLESASLRVWAWDHGAAAWRQAAAMPPSMSHGFYGKRVDINCAGAGQRMLVCANNGEGICSYVMCDLGDDEWVELPELCGNGGDSEFVSALSFEPRIEACVWGTKRMCRNF